VMALVMLGGCGKKVGEEKKLDQVQVQRWAHLKNYGKLVEAYRVAQHHLPESYTAKTIRHAIWLIVTGPLSEVEGGQFKRWDYVGQILALETDPKRRETILRREFEVLAEGDADSLYDGLTLLKRFSPNTKYTKKAIQDGYQKFLSSKNPTFTLYFAAHFKLGEKAMDTAMAKIIVYHRKINIACGPVQIANELKYATPRVEMLRRWCIAKNPESRHVWEGKERPSKAVPGRKKVKRQKTTGSNNRRQPSGTGLESLRPQLQDILGDQP